MTNEPPRKPEYFKQPLSDQERRQIGFLLRFLFTALSVGVVVIIFLGIITNLIF